MISETSREGPLERYMSILEAVAPFAEGLTAADLEAVLGLPKTTVNRLLATLVASRLVDTGGGRNRVYRLGGRVLHLLRTAPDDEWLRAVAQRPLQHLADETGQSAFLSRFDGAEVRSVTCVAPDTPVRTYVVPGAPMPIHAAATAKAILAFQPADVVDRLLVEPLSAFTENTHTTVAAVLADYASVRARGFATEAAEHVPGLASIAYPIATPPAPVVHAVGLTGPHGRIVAHDFERHCGLLDETARRLGKLLALRLPEGSRA